MSATMFSMFYLYKDFVVCNEKSCAKRDGYWHFNNNHIFNTGFTKTTTARGRMDIHLSGLRDLVLHS